MSEEPKTEAERLDELMGRAYRDGKDHATHRILRAIIQDLCEPYDKIAELHAERLAAVIALRELCAEHGDNDWPDNLHLADVIEKHLAKHLSK
jgi:predicted secreted protein